MKTFLTSLLLIASFILTGCPAKTLEKAEASSKKLATYANTGVNVTRDLYREGIISIGVKDKIADAFILLAKGGQAFDLAVASAKTQYGTNPPQSAVNALFNTFNAEVVARFLAVLQQLKLVADSSVYLAVIESVKTAVLIIAAAFDKRQEVEAQL